MKKIDIMFPEMPYMARLIKLMKKYSDKIDREKRHIKGIQSLPNYVKKTQRYNVARFQAIMLYQDVCNQFYQDDKDFTYSLYQERFDETVRQGNGSADLGEGRKELGGSVRPIRPSPPENEAAYRWSDVPHGGGIHGAERGISGGRP